MGVHDILEYRFQRSIWTVCIVVIDSHIRISSLNSGGSLDMYGIVPEIVLGRITVAVSPVFLFHCSKGGQYFKFRYSRAFIISGV